MRRVHGFSGNVPASADHIRPGSPESGSAQTAQLGSAPRARPCAAAVSVLWVRPWLRVSRIASLFFSFSKSMT
jgi:hypothetical protein